MPFLHTLSQLACRLPPACRTVNDLVSLPQTRAPPFASRLQAGTVQGYRLTWKSGFWTDLRDEGVAGDDAV